MKRSTSKIQQEAGRTGTTFQGRVPHLEFPEDVVAPDIQFVVFGLTSPQGSKRIAYINGRPTPVETSAGLDPWRNAVRRQARSTILEMGSSWQGAIREPVYVRAVFVLPSTQAAAKRGDIWHWDDPDLDKLQRALGDAISPQPPPQKAGEGLPPNHKKRVRDELWEAARRHAVLHDDSYIVAWNARKVYPGTTVDALRHPGVLVEVWRLSRLTSQPVTVMTPAQILASYTPRGKSWAEAFDAYSAESHRLSSVVVIEEERYVAPASISLVISSLASAPLTPLTVEMGVNASAL